MYPLIQLFHSQGTKAKEIHRDVQKIIYRDIHELFFLSLKMCTAEN